MEEIRASYRKYNLEATCLVLRQEAAAGDSGDLGAHPPWRELWVYLYMPPEDKRPCPLVIILPILGGQNLWIEEQFARHLADKGLASAIIVFPEQFFRRSFLELTSGFLFLGRRIEALAANFTQAGKDVRFFLDWLETHPRGFGPRQLKTGSIGILGVSLGALAGSVAMAHDTRLKAGAFLLGGADPAWIIAHGSLTKKIVRKLKVSYNDLLPQLEPHNLARQTPAWGGRPVYLVEAIWDTVIPRRSRKLLRQAIPHAEVTRIPAGHYTALVHLFWVQGKIGKFFKDNLQ